MQNEDEIVIALSKFKIILMIAGSLAFVVGGLWLTTLDSEQIESSRKYSNPQIAHAVGYICMAFFGLCAAYGITKLFDSKPGLIFNHKGITDNSSGVAAGLIPWAEISGFSEYQIQRQKMLIIHVQDPKKYVDRGGAMKRALNNANMKMVGSPIAISSNSLKISYSKLLELVENSFSKYGSGA
ncbi:STM3941 family protein [Methylophaga sp. OBS1]|uniref:STM3941 family protein n=1 Tax=Methylophaga sp. OBS1 TaxID=2991933 RepID=UPI0022566E08|nr:STM3941 family protein [Methylophaga sp. OBS1]MCX4191129.1 hypothetical protein [Methylophaga sp. OBS1]MCX4191925.1 hypothetical protein [Methylophaga sp. OBS1]